MPLPTGGTWPPSAAIAINGRLMSWAAWYSGDTYELQAAYGGGASPEAPNVPEGWYQQSAGYAATFAASPRWQAGRTFWGTALSTGEIRSKLHVPVASDIASMSADLLFAEPPALAGETDVTTERLQCYEDMGLWTNLHEAAEICAAMGGVYLRVVWDDVVADCPWVSPVAPDIAIPEWRWDQLMAVTFHRIIETDVPEEYGLRGSAKIVRHLERHESGVILHGVYVGTGTEIGERVPLSTFTETAYLQDEIPTGTALLTAVYVPNIRPNRVWRGLPGGVNLGRSDYSGVEGLMDSLDETWSSWMRDIRLSKARLIVDQSALESGGRGKGATFDADKELLVGLSLGADGSAPLTAIQPLIRAQEHQDTTTALIDQIVRACGYSTSSLMNSTDRGMTATEVSSRERRSLITRGRKVSYWRSGLMRILTALIAVDNAQFDAGLDESCPVVSFPESVFVSLSEMGATLQLLNDAMAVSTETKVAMLHPKWTDEEVDEEVSQIDGVSDDMLAGGIAPMPAITGMSVASAMNAKMTDDMATEPANA